LNKKKEDIIKQNKLKAKLKLKTEQKQNNFNTICIIVWAFLQILELRNFNNRYNSYYDIR